MGLLCCVFSFFYSKLTGEGLEREIFSENPCLGVILSKRYNLFF